MNGFGRLALKKLIFPQFHEHSCMPDYMKLYEKTLLIRQEEQKTRYFGINKVQRYKQRNVCVILLARLGIFFHM